MSSRDESFIKIAIENIKDNWFGGIVQDDFLSEQRLKIIWKCLKDFYLEYRKLPTDEEFKLILLANKDEEIGFDDSFIDDWISKRDKVIINLQLAKSLLKKWKISREITPLLQRAVSSQDEKTIYSTIETILSDKHKLNNDEVTCFDPISSISDQGGIELVSTGIEWIDDLIGGGFGKTDVAVLLGPTGSGKTTLGTQILISSVKANDGISVFFSYEDNKFAIANRIISNAAFIPRNKIREHGANFINVLTTANNPEQYEFILSRRYGVPLGEKERLEAVLDILKNKIVIFDFSSGLINNQQVGFGGYQEIVNSLDYVASKRQQKINIVILDWLGLFIKNFIQYTGTRDIQFRIYNEMQMACQKFYEKISTKFNCPVLLIHQLSGQANTLSPAATISHAHSADCKSLAVTAWHCFVMGALDKETKACKFVCTKSRGGPPKSERIIVLDGKFCRFVDKTDDFWVDKVNGRLIKKSNLEL